MAPGARHPVGGRPRTRRTPAHRGRHGAPPPSTGRLSRHGGVRRTLPRAWRRRTRDATRVRGHRGRRRRHGCPGARRHPPPPSRRPLPRHGRMPGAARLAPGPGQPPVVADAADGRHGRPVVAEGGPPSAGPRVGGCHERLPPVGLRDDLEEQPRAARVGRQEDGPGGPRRPRPRELDKLAGRATRRRGTFPGRTAGGTQRGTSPGASTDGWARARPRTRPRGARRGARPAWACHACPTRPAASPPGSTCGRRRRRASREIPSQAARSLAPSRARRS